MSKRTTSDEVLVTFENGVATITMNRPEKLNAWTQSMRDALTDKMRKVAVDDAAKVAIITGRGKFYRDTKQQLWKMRLACFFLIGHNFSTCCFQVAAFIFNRFASPYSAPAAASVACS